MHLFIMKNTQADSIDECVIMPVIELARINNHFEMHNNSFSAIVDVNNDEYFYNNSVHSNESDLTKKYEDSEDCGSILNDSTETQIFTKNEFNIFNFINNFSYQRSPPKLQNYSSVSIFHIFGNKETDNSINSNNYKEINSCEVSRLDDKSCNNWSIKKLFDNIYPINLFVKFNNQSFYSGLTPFSEFLLKINDFNFL